MQLKSLTQEDEDENPTFPCLRKSSGPDSVIVLFTAKAQGTVISGNTHKLGLYAHDWNWHNFKPYYGAVTIRMEP